MWVGKKQNTQLLNICTSLYPPKLTSLSLTVYGNFDLALWRLPLWVNFQTKSVEKLFEHMIIITIGIYNLYSRMNQINKYLGLTQTYELIKASPFFCSSRSGGFWLPVVELLGLAVTPGWLLWPTAAGWPGAADGGACTAGSTGELLAKESRWGLVRPTQQRQKQI